MPTRSVPFYEYSRAYLDERETLLDIFDVVGKRGAFILQEDVSNFEAELANYVGSKYAVGVGNATDGLELSLKALGLEEGGEVICCSHTMLATASAIKMVGGTPVPVEIGYDNLIDPEAVEDAVNQNTVGIMPTQLNGRTCDMDRLLGVAKRHGLFIVEDAAQALGSRFAGKSAGTFGDAAAISFYPAKLMGCLGDGGAVITNSPNVYDLVFQLHDHGRNVQGEVRGWGRNSRLDNLQAAILLHRLKNYPEAISRRRAIASLYEELLSDIDELSLPVAPNREPEHYDVFQNYEIRSKNRNALKEYLDTKGIGTLIQWGGTPIHQWRLLGFTQDLPKVDAFFKECIMLPMNTFISDEDVAYVCNNVREFHGK